MDEPKVNDPVTYTIGDYGTGYGWEADLERWLPLLALALPFAGGCVVVPFTDEPIFRLMSRNGGDEDYVVIGKRGDRTIEAIAEKLAVCSYEEHVTPRFAIYITNHA